MDAASAIVEIASGSGNTGPGDSASSAGTSDSIKRKQPESVVTFPFQPPKKRVRVDRPGAGWMRGEEGRHLTGVESEIERLGLRTAPWEWTQARMEWVRPQGPREKRLVAQQKKKMCSRLCLVCFFFFYLPIVGGSTPKDGTVFFFSHGMTRNITNQFLNKTKK
jgi:hypothetical protein